MHVIKNRFLEIGLDDTNGSVQLLRDLTTGFDFVAEGVNLLPFILEYDENIFSSKFISFTAVKETDFRLRLAWQIEDGIQLAATVRLSDDTLIINSNVDNNSGKLLSSVEYPVIGGIKDLPDSFAAHPYATGFLVREPFSAFEDDDGFRYMPYPESFSGSSMQFFTYYSHKNAGLYFAAYDGEYCQKWLNFYKRGGYLCASQIYGYENIGKGKPLVCNWDFVIKTTKGDGWYEACDIYKVWALKQKWCQKGKLHEMKENQKAAWLLEDMGACTFGINACHDRTDWIKQYSSDIGAPVFHVLGPDWPRVDQNYYNSLPGGYDDWVPTRFNQNNIDCIKENKDRFAPFEFDFLVSPDKTDSDKIKASLQKWPSIPKAKDGYKFNMLCPICEYTKDLHVKRDTEIIKLSGCDSIYYDISANNIIKTCMSEDHGHPIGAGKLMTEAYREIYEDTKNSLSKQKEKYVPLGTEMMNEVFIDKLDYYQARANAQPCSALETWVFRKLIKSQQAELIPMFKYVYSGYEPLRLDGWGKLTKEGGDIVYHTIAKTYLWGGLFEINSEYSPMETLNGKENDPNEHYYKFDKRGFEYDKKIVSYLSKFAKLRTGKYNPYLAYGEMLIPLEIKCRKLARSYFQYNIGKKGLEQEGRGIVWLDAIIAQGYMFDGKEVVFLANTSEFYESCSLDTKKFKEYTVIDDYQSDDVCAVVNKSSTYSGLKSLNFKPLEIKIILH